MDFNEFEKRFGTESQCRDTLFHLRWPDGFRCPSCNYDEMWETAEHRYKCKRCGYQATVILGTLLQGSRIPLTSWFRAAWFVGSQPDKVTASWLKRELGLGNIHTAQAMIQKLHQAMFRPELDKLAGIVEVGRSRVIAGKQRPFLYIAVESSGKIRLSEVDSTPQSTYEFIGNIVESGSEIVANLPLEARKLESLGCKRKVTSSNYQFGKTSMAFSALQKELDRFPPTGPLADYLNTYSAKVNSTKMPMDSEELLRRAVNMKPLPKRQK